MMQNQLTTAWGMLMGRVQGPLTLRLIIQPAMASFFAIRSGLKDARDGRPPYVWKIFKKPTHRHQLLQHGWKEVRVVFLMAFLLDSVYQFIVFRWIYLGQALIVAIALAIVPYVLLRGPVNRLVRRFRTRPLESELPSAGLPPEAADSAKVAHMRVRR